MDLQKRDTGKVTQVKMLLLNMRSQCFPFLPLAAFVGTVCGVAVVAGHFARLDVEGAVTR